MMNVGGFQPDFATRTFQLSILMTLPVEKWGEQLFNAIYDT